MSRKPAKSKTSVKRPIHRESVASVSARPDIHLNIAPGQLKPSAAEELMRINGRYGLFIPLTGAEGQPPSGSETDNIHTIVDALQKRINDLTDENAGLKRRIEEIGKPAHSPDDFAQALQHSIDTLQSRFSTMANSISDFALKEFKLESAVHIDVNNMGLMAYRFIQPGEQVNEQEVSRITVNIVPLPKQQAAGTMTRTSFTPLTAIEEIDGVGDKHRAIFNDHQIYTLADLLTAGTRAKSRVELSAMLGLERKELDNWLGQAQLMTVRDVQGRDARILSEIHINSLDGLANETAETLTERFNTCAKAKGFASIRQLTPERAAEWIATARQFIGVKPIPITPQNGSEVAQEKKKIP